MDEASTVLPAPRKRAVFFDRDGTLNEMVYDENHGTMDSPMNRDQVRLLPGAAEAIAQLRAMGYLVIVVTNQPGIAKGTLDFPRLNGINQRLSDLIQGHAARWDALYCCPHHPTMGTRSEFTRECSCRKPKPGLLLEAARDFSVDLKGSWMVGDGVVDVEAGRAAGCRTIQVTSLKLEQIEKFIQLKVVPDFLSPGLAAVPAIIRSADFADNQRPSGNGRLTG